MHNNESPEPTQERWLALFEDRYGIESYRLLMSMLEQPCVTFADIARRFGVSRERARQWQARFLPDAPRGHERRRLCLLQRQKRTLLVDPLFRAFYRHARPHFESGGVVLIRARDGFRKRTVRLNGRLIAIKSARAIPRGKRSTAASYTLTSSIGPVDFIYYRLTDADYLLLPFGLVPSSGTTFLDAASSRYHAYRNTFAAVREPAVTVKDAPAVGWRDEAECVSMAQ